MKLTKIIYIGRHGERGALEIPLRYLKDWDQPGLLTSKGEQTQYKQGQYLRNKYSEFLKSINERVFCQSSNMDRTINSGFCLLSGLLGLPFTSPSIVNKKDKTIFLTNHGARLKPLSKDVIFRGYYQDVSPGIDSQYDALIKNALDIKDHFEELNPILPIAADLFKQNTKLSMDYSCLNCLSDFLECYYINDKPFPKGFEDGKVFDQLKFIHYYMTYDLMFKSDIIRRVTNHYHYKELMYIINDESGSLFYYYSSHDSIIFSIILGLGYNIGEDRKSVV